MMFDLNKSIKHWLKSLRKYKAFSPGFVREIELHIKDHIDDLVAKGWDEKAAFERAIAEFGQPSEVAKEEFTNYQRRPGINSTLNTIMINTYFKVAFRNFWKHKFYSLINLSGLTAGFAIVFLIGLFVQDELSFDQFHRKKDTVYRVVENQYYAGQPVFPVAVTPVALGPSLPEEYPEILRSARLYYDGYRFDLGGKMILEEKGITADAEIFEILSYPVIKGSISTFKEDLHGLILTEKLAKKYFGDRDPVDQVIKLNDEDFVVRAIIEDVPSNTHLPFTFVINFEHFLAENPEASLNWGSNSLYTYIELDPRANFQEVNSKIKGQIKKNRENSVTDIYLQPVTDIYLGQVDFTADTPMKGQAKYVRIFSVVAIFILIISCINFMNLSTARSIKRAKEVGLRKTVGANRMQLIVQFLSESVFLTLFAIALAVTLVALLLPYFNQVTGKDFSISDLTNPLIGIKIVAALLLMAIITGIFAGSYPALYLSSYSPASVLKSQVTANRSGTVIRRFLVIFQFVISIVLIIGTIVVYKQLNYIRDVNLGYNKDNIAYTFVLPDKAKVFADALRQRPEIINAGLANRHPGYVLSSTSGFNWPGKDSEEIILIHYMGADENYMPTMEMKMVEGRGFVESDSMVIIINERAREIMGLSDPVGEIITGQQEYPIVGVAEDFNFKSIHTSIEPIVIFKVRETNRVYLRFDPRAEDDISETVKSVWNDFFPDRDFELEYLESDFLEMYQAEQRTGKLSTYFSLFAIFISCLGLFGLVAYATELRTKEIGVRKVLGASIPRIIYLLTSDFINLIVVSMIIAIPIGWIGMKMWLETYAYKITLSADAFILAGMLALFIALLTIGYLSVRASLRNPVHSLRNE